MDIELNKIFVNVEEIIITLIKEYRYSHQLIRSVDTLSSHLFIPKMQLDYSIESLETIDRYIDILTKRTCPSLEICLAITIYVSQVVILSCNGIWSITTNVFSSPEEILTTKERKWIYFLRIAILNTNCVIQPHSIVMNNLLNKKSKLKIKVKNLLLEIKNNKTEEIKDSERYNLTILDKLMIEGKDLKCEFSSLILNLSKIFNISENKLNRSVSSLKIIDEFIHNNGKNILDDTTNCLDENTFFSLLVYVGEVIIKSVDGKWKINPERIITKSHGPQYHWNLRVLNSEDRVLRDFTSNLCDHLIFRNHTHCQIQKLVKSYIFADKKRDDFVWYDFQQYHKKRIWKMESTDSFVVGLNDEIGTISDLIIPTIGY